MDLEHLLLGLGLRPSPNALQFKTQGYGPRCPWPLLMGLFTPVEGPPAGGRGPLLHLTTGAIGLGGPLFDPTLTPLEAPIIPQYAPISA